MSFSVTVVTTWSDFVSNAFLSPSAPTNFVPSGNPPDASMGSDDSPRVRDLPTASKFSSDKPSGSMIAWQLEHAGFSRCCTIRSRIDKTAPAALVGFNSGTFGGGGGGDVPRKFSRIHLPRTTGDVRSGWDVTVRMLP